MKNLSPNHKVLDVLAASSVYWAMDLYASGAVDEDDAYDVPWDQLKTPHAAQIVAILRLLVCFCVHQPFAIFLTCFTGIG